jgi:hypothetical protein
MPAKSKPQQRLFAMVHAYNKGELHCDMRLRKRIATLSKRISDEDASHFAETRHAGLPERTEKKAQVMVRPDVLQDMYGRIPVGGYATRSGRRRSFLDRVLYGTGTVAVLGGLGAAGLGAFIVNNAANGSNADPAEVRRKMLEAAARCGLWGAGRGAAFGSVAGAGLGILDKVRG